jgi:hypothetical protein
LSSGLVPPPPESGWHVYYEGALVSWLRTNPNTGDVADFLEWIERAKEAGPPNSGLSIDNDYFVDGVNNRITVGYLVQGWEYRIGIRHIF